MYEATQQTSEDAASDLFVLRGARERPRGSRVGDSDAAVGRQPREREPRQRRHPHEVPARAECLRHILTHAAQAISLR